MFFTLSKVLWFVADPGNLLLMALILGCGLLATRWRRAGARLLAAVAVAAAVIAVVPVGDWLIGALEDRFPPLAELPPRVDGIVVAGGVVDPVLSGERGTVAVGGAAERLFAMADLARRYPGAKLIFSGGSGRLLHPEKREAPWVAPLLERLGVAPARVMMEDRARNTAENADYSYRLARPKSGETWLLVTSAFHMSRAVGCFRRVGWAVTPYPVDYMTGKSDPTLRFDFGGGLSALATATHEYLGLLFYWIVGNTDTLFPAPN